MKLKLLIASILVLLGLVAYQKYSEYSVLKSIDSYESCASVKGSTIQTSYPATCITRLGSRFTELITPTLINPTTQPSSINKTFSHTLISEKNGKGIYTNYSFEYPSNFTVEEQAAATYALLTEPNNPDTIAFYADERQVEIKPFKQSQQKTFFSKNGQIRIICFKDYCTSAAYNLILSTFKFTD